MKIDFARPDREHERLREPLEQAAARVLRSGRSILGEEVTRFEQAFAKSAGTTFAVGISSGTDALATALLALGIGEGDEVVVGAFGFVAAPEAVVRVGARPVFVDLEPSALALDVAQVARAVTPRTRAIISVDLFGLVHDTAPLREVAPNAAIVEDAAQALGAFFGSSPAGTLGDIGVFSFFPSKALGAVGDGGACVTHDARLAARMAQVRSHGAGKTYAWEMRGGNHRLDALQAALLAVKLEHLPTRLARRRAIGERLVAAARRGDVAPLVGAPGCAPMFAPLALRASEAGRRPRRVTQPSGGRRNAWLAHLRERGIDARVHYPTTLAASPPFARFAGAAAFPEAELATRELLSVPCHPEMTDDEVSELEAALSHGVERQHIQHG